VKSGERVRTGEGVRREERERKKISSVRFFPSRILLTKTRRTGEEKKTYLEDKKEEKDNEKIMFEK
jgi:hypothetical protein